MNEHPAATSLLEARSLYANYKGEQLVLAIAKSLDAAYEEGQRSVREWDTLIERCKNRGSF